MKIIPACRVAALFAALCASSSFVWAQTTTKKAVPSPVYCAVTGEKIGDAKSAAASKVYNGKTYYMCCPGCAPRFEATPAKFAKIADLNTEKRALEAKLSRVNAELKKADSNTSVAVPTKVETTVVASSVLHCAITDESIASVKDAAGSAVYNNKTYYFCCPGCVTKFKADPAKFAAQADKRNAARVN